MTKYKDKLISAKDVRAVAEALAFFLLSHDAKKQKKWARTIKKVERVLDWLTVNND